MCVPAAASVKSELLHQIPPTIDWILLLNLLLLELQHFKYRWGCVSQVSVPANRGGSFVPRGSGSRLFWNPWSKKRLLNFSEKHLLVVNNVG